MKLNKNAGIAAIVIVVLIGAFFLFSGYSTQNKKMTENNVLLIGIDGTDPKVVQKLMDEGKLPNFKKLSEQGSFSNLETTIPPETPVAWSAAATGTNPGKYGIFDFLSRDPKTYLPQLHLAEEKQGTLGTIGSVFENAMKGTPFWRITSEAGIPTSVIRWPVTFPAEKVNGKMLSGLGTPDVKGLLNSYRFYTSEDFDRQSEGAEKIVKVRKFGDLIETKLGGPMTKRGGQVVEAELPMAIKTTQNGATITIDGKSYNVKAGGWSDFIKVKFHIGFLTDVYGVFKVYLASTEPEFNMYVSSIQIDPSNQLAPITYPKEYGKELEKAVGPFYTLGLQEETKAVTEHRIGEDVFFENVKDIEGQRTKMFWYEFDRFQKDGGVLAFGFDASDRLQHIFWRNKILGGNSSDYVISKEIEDYYVEKDKWLGELLSKLDGKTKLIIFSDHGFTSFERAVSINTWLVDNGYMTLTKKPTEKDAGELFKYVDWDKTKVYSAAGGTGLTGEGTKAYSVGFGSIYINQKGREAKGIVDEKDKEVLIEELIQKLNKIKDPKYNKTIITKVYKGADIYIGKYAKDGPDVVVGFEAGYRMSWQNAVGGLTPEIIADNGEDKEWVGDHLIDPSHVPGVIFTNFKISKENPRLIDIAPTVLKLFDIKEPKEMDGKAVI